ncbi:MAG: transglutaminase domain-containing protein [Pirellulales bacterium]|nr:transglutaminase domain-containing protein [Pirellulales bacterium]
MGRFTRRKFLVGGSCSLLGAVGGQGFLTTQCQAAEGEISGGVRLGEANTYRVRHRVVVDMGTLPFTLLEIWLPLPLVDAEICPEQSVDSLKIEPKSRISFDTHKLARVANRAFGTRDAGQPRRTYSLEASYEVTVRSQLFDLELHTRYGGSEAGGENQYKRDARYRLYTRSENKSPTSHASIKSLVRQIKPADNSPLQIARAYYDWIIDNVKYEKMNSFGGAVTCLKDRCGECGDFSALFVALCRASGIPARPVVGYWADKSNDWHCWAQFMLPNGRWLPVDCQIGSNGVYARRMNFGRTDNRRVALCKTFDVCLTRTAGKNRVADYLQNGRWWWEAKGLPPKFPQPTGIFEISGQAVSTGR